jgi:hypothetical protein
MGLKRNGWFILEKINTRRHHRIDGQFKARVERGRSGLPKLSPDQR